MNFFTRYKVVFIAVSLVLMVASAMWLLKYNRELLTAEAPLKIVSLELAWSNQKATRVADSWSVDQTTSALYSIYVDYLFILAYTLFLMVCVLAANIDPQLTFRTKVFLTLAAGALLTDVIENIFMTSFLNERQTPAILFSFPATLKFLCIVVVALYLIYMIMTFFKKRIVFREGF
jgi:hypothetical protein